MNGIIFDIIGFLSQHLRAVGLRGILFYAVSPIADESSNILIYVGNDVYREDMIGQSLLFYAADSSLQEKYQEPCVVFAGHPSLRSEESDYDCEGAMSTFEGLQIKPIDLPIDIRLTVNEANLPNSLITLYECLNIVNISINSQFVRAVMTENLASNIVLVTNLGKIR
ncbi:unnamed protein product [Rhizophagus irregularis]|nr:unnamed protein product [Rhizophagus irregularis]